MHYTEQTGTDAKDAFIVEEEKLTNGPQCLLSRISNYSSCTHNQIQIILVLSLTLKPENIFPTKAFTENYAYENVMKVYFSVKFFPLLNAITLADDLSRIPRLFASAY
jgi:chorismate mutase